MKKVAYQLGLLALLQVAAAKERKKMAINWDVFDHGTSDKFEWIRPFPSDGSEMGGATIECEHEATFHGTQHNVAELQAMSLHNTPGWRHAIDFLLSPSYPGSWDGVDKKGTSRELVIMKQRDVPEYALEWIRQRHESEAEKERQGDKRKEYGAFLLEMPKDVETEKLMEGVQKDDKPAANDEPDDHKVLVFAPGAIYDILPLWVAKGSKCESDMLNLSKYVSQVKDHAVVAWVIEHTKPEDPMRGKRDINFTIDARVVLETEEAKVARKAWDRIQVAARRQERKIKKREMEEAKKAMKDEL